MLQQFRKHKIKWFPIAYDEHTSYSNYRMQIVDNAQFNDATLHIYIFVVAQEICSYLFFGFVSLSKSVNGLIFCVGNGIINHNHTARSK